MIPSQDGVIGGKAVGGSTGRGQGRLVGLDPGVGGPRKWGEVGLPGRALKGQSWPAPRCREWEQEQALREGRALGLKALETGHAGQAGTLGSDRVGPSCVLTLHSPAGKPPCVALSALLLCHEHGQHSSAGLTQ